MYGVYNRLIVMCFSYSEILPDHMGCLSDPVTCCSLSFPWDWILIQEQKFVEWVVGIWLSIRRVDRITYSFRCMSITTRSVATKTAMLPYLV